MNGHSGGRNGAAALLAAGAALALAAGVTFAVHAQPKGPAAKVAACAGGDTGITLPPGFCATIFADNLGATRHIAVAADGAVYVNTWNGSS